MYRLQGLTTNTLIRRAPRWVRKSCILLLVCPYLNIIHDEPKYSVHLRTLIKDDDEKENSEKVKNKTCAV